MIAAVSLFLSIVLGIASAAWGRVVWQGPPDNVDRPVVAWLGRIAILVVMIAATGLAALLYRENRGPTVWDFTAPAPSDQVQY